VTRKKPPPPTLPLRPPVAPCPPPWSNKPRRAPRTRLWCASNARDPKHAPGTRIDTHHLTVLPGTGTQVCLATPRPLAAVRYRGIGWRGEVPDSRLEDIKRTSQDPRTSLRAPGSCSPICAPRSCRSTPKHLCAVLPASKSKLTEVWPHSHPPSELCGFGRETQTRPKRTNQTKSQGPHNLIPIHCREKAT
jgi:hypothetical protein